MANLLNGSQVYVREKAGSWIWLGLILTPALLMGIYALGFASDLGISFFQQGLLHDFFHDARHAAGFPCH